MTVAEIRTQLQRDFADDAWALAYLDELDDAGLLVLALGPQEIARQIKTRTTTR